MNPERKCRQNTIQKRTNQWKANCFFMTPGSKINLWQDKISRKINKWHRNRTTRKTVKKNTMKLLTFWFISTISSDIFYPFTLFSKSFKIAFCWLIFSTFRIVSSYLRSVSKRSFFVKCPLFQFSVLRFGKNDLISFSFFFQVFVLKRNIFFRFKFENRFRFSQHNFFQSFSVLKITNRSFRNKWLSFESKTESDRFENSFWKKRKQKIYELKIWGNRSIKFSNFAI